MLIDKFKRILGIEKQSMQSIGADDAQKMGKEKQKTGALNENDRYYQDLLGIKQMPEVGSLNNEDTRKWYLANMDKIDESIVQFRSLEEQARQAYNLRDWLKIKARELMANREQAIQLERTDPALTYEEVCQRQTRKGLAYWEHICAGVIRTSAKSRESVNKELGVEPPSSEVDPLWKPYLKLPSEYDVALVSKEQNQSKDEMDEVKNKGGLKIRRLNKRTNIELEI